MNRKKIAIRCFLPLFSGMVISFLGLISSTILSDALTVHRTPNILAQLSDPSSNRPMVAMEHSSQGLSDIEQHPSDPIEESDDDFSDFFIYEDVAIFIKPSSNTKTFIGSAFLNSALKSISLPLRC